MSKIAAARATVERIRELLKQGIGVRETARRVGKTHGCVSHIKQGRRHNKNRDVTLNQLGLRRVGGKLCRRCGEPMEIAMTDGQCLQCGVGELVRQGVVQLATT